MLFLLKINLVLLADVLGEHDVTKTAVVFFHVILQVGDNIHGTPAAIVIEEFGIFLGPVGRFG
jgi:hypothetical protein